MSDERVSAPTFAKARELLGDQGVMDLTGLIGYYNFVNITLKSFNLQLAPGREPLLPDLWYRRSPLPRCAGVLSSMFGSACGAS